jgi:transposase IS66-like protein
MGSPLKNVEPFARLRDVLQRMTDGHPASRHELLPWNWQPISVKAQATCKEWTLTMLLAVLETEPDFFFD